MSIEFAINIEFGTLPIDYFVQFALNNNAYVGSKYYFTKINNTFITNYSDSKTQLFFSNCDTGTTDQNTLEAE